jgi:hypothetical protein
MRPPASFALFSLALTLALWSPAGRTQSDRDYVFQDEDGHLVLRFAGIGDKALDSSQAYEILNQEFSRMVHDRLHADLQFAGERRDPEWAASMEPQIAEQVERTRLEYSDLFVECHAASCRVIMEQRKRWSVPAHVAVLETVQESLEAFIADHPESFEPVFLITAYEQENETSHIKAFLRRTGHELHLDAEHGARHE